MAAELSGMAMALSVLNWSGCIQQTLRSKSTCDHSRYSTLFSRRPQASVNRAIWLRCRGRAARSLSRSSWVSQRNRPLDSLSLRIFGADLIHFQSTAQFRTRWMASMCRLIVAFDTPSVVRVDRPSRRLAMSSSITSSVISSSIFPLRNGADHLSIDLSCSIVRLSAFSAVYLATAASHVREGVSPSLSCRHKSAFRRSWNSCAACLDVVPVLRLIRCPLTERSTNQNSEPACL